MKDKKEISYEESIEKLNIILKELESDDLTLEESMDRFKMGMDLYKKCNEILEKTEGEIKIIIEKDSTVSEEDFIGEDD